MKKNFIEKLLTTMAYLGLAGGIACGLSNAYCIWKPQGDMWFPQVIFALAGCTFAALFFWALLLTAANISRRTRRIEKRLQEKAD